MVVDDLERLRMIKADLGKIKEDLRKPQILNVVLYCCLPRTALQQVDGAIVLVTVHQ